MDTINQQLRALLEREGARFRVVDHPEAGKSEEVARIRGTDNSQGAKAMVCAVKQADGAVRHALAVLPGDRRLDFAALADALQAKKAGMADREAAMAISGCEIGAIPPFAFTPALVLVVDPLLTRRHAEIAFNAGRLDQSIVLDSADYLRIAQPLLAAISKP